MFTGLWGMKGTQAFRPHSTSGQTPFLPPSSCLGASATGSDCLGSWSSWFGRAMPILASPQLSPALSLDLVLACWAIPAP